MLELKEKLRLWLGRKPGDEPRRLGVLDDDDMRVWKRRSKGRKDGVGLFRKGRDATEGSTLLPGEETRDPCKRLDQGNSW